MSGSYNRAAKKNPSAERAASNQCRGRISLNDPHGAAGDEVGGVALKGALE
ncbi:MAG: hypothetical protein OXF47_06215 [Nitrospira sp.]|nr:hypothetical protein [Nitrospira sp.]